MASTPDPHPDSIPTGPADNIEGVSRAGDSGRESVEDTPTHEVPDSPGTPGGTAGTGGVNNVQEDLDR